MDALTSPMLVYALAAVPEKHLRIIDLPWKYLTDEGELDYQKLGMNMKEVEEAVHEAKGYVAGTRRLLESVRHLAGVK